MVDARPHPQPFFRDSVVLTTPSSGAGILTHDEDAKPKAQPAHHHHHTSWSSSSAQPGQIITQCVASDMVALTFDDGPGTNTQEIVDMLDQLKIKGTFFVNGHNLVGDNAHENRRLLQ
ncbi:hypothetical protein SYNPS1DRAFT_19433 [Syncephalis pseudoplumigaleata]|uniref:NodB homology domain-containing protein n=1 Tax=Syncephalis pseudoplumigaleata TaxID=1712513 RepID=A0A4P9YSI5_9FUNG|nr:hypothetical protein SYNPS1DRAFT_19433 [Syncephalis pseudoplumigaleata]|eukprot:RKP22876.1 hypothetical protein SYNPS1DRAFT_19433 [Syncephalis pseudoplumigaleata]